MHSFQHIVSRFSDVAVKNRHPAGRQGHSQATRDSINLSHGFLRQDRLYLEIETAEADLWDYFFLFLPFIM